MSRPAWPRDAHLRDLSPRRIGAELDRHVVGQGKAKKAVAVALRDRWRRQQLPPEVAREITRTVEQTPREKPPRYDWVVTHVWSYFKKSPGTDENAEDMSQANATANGGIRGYSPAAWCAERLPASIRAIGPEEMVWRIRMKHDPSQTKEFMRQIK